MKKIDLKPFLMEKGERVGLYVAGGLALLLVGIGVVKGFSSGSASGNAGKLNERLDQLAQLQSNARPEQDKGHLPENDGKDTASASDNYRSVDPSAYLAHE